MATPDRISAVTRDLGRNIGSLMVLGLGLTVLGWPGVVAVDVRQSAMHLDLKNALAAPSFAGPWLGTDALGRDLLARVALALRDTVLPLWGVVVLADVTGVLAGLCAVLSGGAGEAEFSASSPWPRWTVFTGVRIADVLAAVVAGIPVGILAFAGAAWREEAGLGPVAAALAAVCCVRGYLLTRDLHRQTRSLAWWTADAALGGSLARRLWRHGVAGAWRRTLVEALGFHLKVAVGIEAALSYLGFGVSEPTPSLGNMLASHFDLYLKGQWQILAVVVGALALVAALPSAAVNVLSLLARLWRRRLRDHSQLAALLGRSSRSLVQVPTPPRS